MTQHYILFNSGLCQLLSVIVWKQSLSPHLKRRLHVRDVWERYYLYYWGGYLYVYLGHIADFYACKPGAIGLSRVCLSWSPLINGWVADLHFRRGGQFCTWLLWSAKSILVSSELRPAQNAWTSPPPLPPSSRMFSLSSSLHMASLKETDYKV